MLGGDAQPTFFSRFDWVRSQEYEHFSEYIAKKYGKKDFKPVKLSVNVRDLGTTPLHAPEISLEARKAIAKIHTDSKLSKDQRSERAQSLRNAFLNDPQIINSTTLKGHDKEGHEIYHYFPRLQFDFSADLFSSSNFDRFSQLAMVILIPKTDFRKGVRFLDFSPKGADIAEFTRGQLQQQSQLAAKASVEAAEPIAQSVSLGGELSYTATETFTRDLKDAIEQRTVGIIENGRGFLVQLRAIKQLRVGGTYTFDVTLEIPSIPENLTGEKHYQAEPVISRLVPKILLVSVVRHVYDRGMTGWFTRVPETENDDVYEQVVIKEIYNQKIWEFNEVPWIRPIVIKVPTFTAKIITNRKDARFAILDKGHNILAHGTGEKAELSIPIGRILGTVAWLKFFPVVHTPTEGNPTNLKPTPATIRITDLAGKKNISRTFSTTYTAP